MPIRALPMDVHGTIVGGSRFDEALLQPAAIAADATST
jgi:hypothetical protein